MSAETLKNNFLDALNHIGNVLTKVSQNSGPGSFLLDADLHTLAEGLFLYAFTHWEQFTRGLLIEDVATSSNSTVHVNVQRFATTDSALRLANQILQHPDHPNKFVEWSNYAEIISRANEYVGAGNRFAVTPLPRRTDLELLKRVRNAIAHRSDRAWHSFLKLCDDAPFSIPANRMTGMTPGRFLVTESWHGQPVLRDALSLLDAAACHLVP